MEFYVDEKQRQKKRRIFKIKLYAGLAISLFLLAGLFYAVVYSSMLRITQINTDFTQIYSDEIKKQIIQDLRDFFANQSKIAKFLGADNILVWSDNAENFLKTKPYLIGLAIEKDFFKRQVLIKTEVREKFGIWCQLTTNNCFWFDKSGVVFERAPKTEGEMIYKVNDFSERQLAVGDQSLEKHLFENLLKIFNILERAGLNVRTLQIKDLSLQEAVIEPNNPLIPKIYFSLRFDPEFSLAAFQSLKETGLAKIEYVDLRVENRAYYKLK